ncbi:MAG: TonB-dependent receptor [Candidatus Marinimicrobia bacterium]|jgi:TonB-dependent receptor|nr:TonB-dependent receptor [Candidatus Neomarinimicrobiota bacterium]
MKVRRVSTIIILISFAQFIYAANISGKVTGASSGDFLPGANVMLDGTNFGTSSDRSGNFNINNVPEGDYTLKVTYVGYSDYSEVVTMGSESISRDISLSVDYVAMEAVNVNGLAQGQAKALSQQRSAGNIKNVVSRDQMEKFPDQNVADVLQRLPGIALESDHGEGRYVQIRGAEASLNTTTINGVKVPSPEDVRKISLDIIPSYSLGSVEVTKAITPDMDGDAIGGHVNLITKNAFDYNGQFMEAKVAGGHRPLYGKNGGMGAFTYGNQFMDGKLGLIVSSSYEFNDMKTDNIELEWADKYEYVTDVVDSEEDETYVVEEADGDIVTDIALKNYSLSRERVGITSSLDYKLAKNSKLFANFISNKYTDIENRNRLRYRLDKSVDEETPGSGYFDVTSKGGTAKLARIYRELKSRSSISKINSVSLGGEHALGKLGLDWSVTKSYAEELRDPSVNAEFVVKDINMDYEFSDVNHPKVSNFTDEDGAAFDQHDLSSYELDEIEIEGDYIPNAKKPNGNLVSGDDQVLAFNLSMPLALGGANGKIKVGGKLSSKEKESDKSGGELWGWDGDDDLLMKGFSMDIDGEKYMEDNYVHTHGIDVKKIRDHMSANIGSYEILPLYEDAILETWVATEDISAFYGMADMKIGKINFIGGARMENTSSTYNSWSGNVEDAEDGEYDIPTSLDSFFIAQKVSKDYTNVLPMAHVRYAVNDRTLIRAAYTESIARADFAALVPFIAADGDDAEAGNPELESAHSKNIDFMLEYYPKGLGIFSFGYFSKAIDNYIYTAVLKDVTIRKGAKVYDEVVMPVNGKDATLSGWEMNFQKNLNFLPGPLSSLSLYFNFTSTSSEADYGSEREKTTFPGQAANTGNLSFAYETSKLTARVSQSIADQYIVEVGEDKDEDIYYDPANRLDFSLSYNFNNKLSFFADVLNITNVPHVYFMGDANRPVEKEVYGSTVKIGTNYRF